MVSCRTQAPSSLRDHPDSSRQPHPRRVIPAHGLPEQNYKLPCVRHYSRCTTQTCGHFLEHFVCFHDAHQHSEVIEKAGYAFSALLQDIGADHGVDRGEAIAAVSSLELI